MPHAKLTTEAGAPVANNVHSQTAGPAGPSLLPDHHLIGAGHLARADADLGERLRQALGQGS